jgi:hypothetical protein
MLKGGSVSPEYNPGVASMGMGRRRELKATAPLSSRDTAQESGQKFADIKRRRAWERRHSIGGGAPRR